MTAGIDSYMHGTLAPLGRPVEALETAERGLANAASPGGLAGGGALTSARPRAAFLTPVMPARTGVGLAMRAGSQLAGLSRVFDVTVLMIPCAGRPDGLDAFHQAFPGVRIEILDIRGHVDPFFRIIATCYSMEERNALFARYGKPSLAAGISGTVAARVAEVVRRTEARWVHVFRSYLVSALDDVPDNTPRSIDLDEDDVSSCRSIAALLDQRGRTGEARWSTLEAEAFERLVAEKLGKFRAATLANAMDATRLAQRHGGISFGAVPNCVSLPPLRERRDQIPKRDGLLFVGTLGYWPNTDGLEWFMTSVLPRIPSVRLRIAGADPPPVLRKIAPRHRVEFLGFVKDLAPVYRQAAVAIAPMRCGGGTRLKILEAGAFGVPVVATPEAASGIWKSTRPWGMTAGSAGRFAAACRALLAAPDQSRGLGVAGRFEVARSFSSRRIDAEWAQLFHRLYDGEDV